MHNQLARYCLENLPLKKAGLSDSYYYASLPQCIIDAVFSIGVKYQSTMNVVGRYCRKSGIARYRVIGSGYPARSRQRTVENLISDIDLYAGFGEAAEQLFGSRQRTSSQSGILKAEAVSRFAKALTKHGVNCFQDIPAARDNEALKRSIMQIPGQKSGISWSYFLMLTGADNYIKPDRMILRFVKRATGVVISAQEAQSLLEQTIAIINQTYPNLTLRELDCEIWKYEREQNNP